MNQDILNKLNKRQDLIEFIRKNPIWYRHLTREPNRFEEFEKAAKVFYGKTIPQRISKLDQDIKMFNLMIQLVRPEEDS